MAPRLKEQYDSEIRGKLKVQIIPIRRPKSRGRLAGRLQHAVLDSPGADCCQEGGQIGSFEGLAVDKRAAFEPHRGPVARP